MLEKIEKNTDFDRSVLNLPNKLENEQKAEDDLLNLLAEIIVEILIKNRNECNRIYQNQ